MSDDRILAIDIGAGTMDVLLYDPAQPMENAVQLVLPSATAIAGRKIAAAREAGRDVFREIDRRRREGHTRGSRVRHD